ncbi:MAG: hypothetical protein NC201_01765 [Prevotella sp.]|nr:hypothetical protein [Bacteroides sp.]MCM1365955.1 hypothetical protein [Prevotella sp.]MCM1436624.1 hypothetical protein [Prevotella sp.]
MREEIKQLEQDPDGLQTYEYIVNHVDDVENELTELCSMMRCCDKSGQFLASTARFLSAVDNEKFSPYIGGFIEGAMERDRERKYIGSLLESIWGNDYKERAEELSHEDDLFRRIYKRIYDKSII